ncbi:MAG: NIPSNAP family protein [Thermomicrobiales bacterium]
MIYELRTYTATPGMMDRLHARFRDNTRRIFARHGIQSVGYWVQSAPDDGTGDLVYLVTHASAEAAVENWQAFRADPEWIAAKAESERDGPIVANITSRFLEPTDYSALQ